MQKHSSSFAARRRRHEPRPSRQPLSAAAAAQSSYPRMQRRANGDAYSEFLGPMARRGAVATSRNTGKSLNTQQPRHHSRRSSRTSKPTALALALHQQVPYNSNSYHPAHERFRNHQHYRRHLSHLPRPQPLQPSPVHNAPPPRPHQYHYVKKEFVAYSPSPSPQQRSSPPPMSVVFCSNNNAANYGEHDDVSVSELSYNHSMQQQTQRQHDQRQQQSYWEGRDGDILPAQQQNMASLQPDDYKDQSTDDTYRMLSRKDRAELLKKLMRDTQKPAPPPEDEITILPSDVMFGIPPVEDQFEINHSKVARRSRKESWRGRENHANATVDDFIVHSSDVTLWLPPVEEHLEAEHQRLVRPTRKESRRGQEHFEGNHKVPHQEQPGRHVTKHWDRPPKSPLLFHEQIQLQFEYQQSQMDGDGDVPYPAGSHSCLDDDHCYNRRSRSPSAGVHRPSVDNDYDFAEAVGKWW